MKSPSRVLCCCAFLAVALLPSLRAELPIITLARAYVGPDAVLDSVEALRMVGELEVVESGATAPGTASIEIVFKKPDRQRITATSEAKTEITALDGYDAWSRVSDSTNPSAWQVSLLGADQIKRLRANTFENLAFYRGLESRCARIEERGTSKVDGVECRKLAFIHGPDIVFLRSFDPATGRLMLTETDSGTQIREEGELRSGGLRFPKRIVTTNTLPDGSTRSIRVTFTQIDVNPVIGDEIFALPSLSN